ncbi:hypothetical protein E3N88_09072 [Mikania micrantha]|uniref:Uncharacterized protein n=1 Tax=Mikania micrantha TaxID=192012 RepID=A0A5N6PKB5_9ASTR|nr:hypothetical protein E3N88_09072 [Mikania micrantha]
MGTVKNDRLHGKNLLIEEAGIGEELLDRITTIKGDQFVEGSGEDVEGSGMNPALKNDQEDRGKRGDDQEDREDSSVESLRILVDEFQIGKEPCGDEDMKLRDKKKRLWNELRMKKKIKPFDQQNVPTAIVQEPFEKSEDGKELNEVPTVNLNKVDKLSETEIMWKHFEEMELDDQKKKRMKDDGKGKEPIEGPTTKDVKSIEEMVIFLDLIIAVNENLLQEEFVKIKFNKMVKWFNKYVIKKDDFWCQ